MEMNIPRAFLCHGSEDKPLIVKPFGRALADLGVDPWMDGWEMFPGDSLVTKIEEGLKSSDLFLPFLTPTSIDKPWVRQEIEAAVVRRVMDAIRIIPVVVGLQKEALPPFLAGTVWIPLSGPEGVEEAAERAARAIFRVSDKPLVSPRPAYLAYAGPGVYGLSSVDIVVLKAAGEAALAAGQLHLNVESVLFVLASTGMPVHAFRESVDVLDEKGYVKKQGVLGNPYKYLEVTVSGFEAYCERFFEGYPDVARRIAIAIVEGDEPHPDRGRRPAEAKELAERIGVPPLVAIQVFKNLERLGRVKLGKSLGIYQAWSVSAGFKRELLASKEQGLEEAPERV